MAVQEGEDPQGRAAGADWDPDNGAAAPLASSAPRPRSGGGGRRRSRVQAAIVGGAVVVLAAAALAIVVGVHLGHGATRHALVVVTPPAALNVAGVTPAPGSTIGFNDPLTVEFSAPLAKTTPFPVLTPEVPGTWSRTSARTLVFQPSANYAPMSTVELTVAAGVAGPESARGGDLLSPYSASYTVERPSMLRLQQVLAELGYLPVAFEPAPADAATATAPASAPTTTAPAPARGAPPSALVGEPTSAEEVPLTPQPGTFAWRFKGIPAALSSLWQPGAETTVVVGAVMAYQASHGFEDNGVVDAPLWSSMLAAVATRQVSASPYDYVEVSEQVPESLSVWQNGKVVYHSLANTGIAAAPTALGTYPVYARFVSTTMSGFNPDGSHYSDPGVPYVAYFNGGDAVHGFPRPGYGYPQSLGCVELPYSSAPVVYNYDPIGTLVTVS